MPIMQTNTMRYGFDDFRFSKQGHIEAKKAFDCTKVTNVEGFNITGAQPQGTKRKILFKIDDTIYKLSTTEGIASLADENITQKFTTESILEEGNTIEELLLISSIPEFVTKNIYPIIALEAESEVEVMPTVKLELKTRNNQDQFQKEENSAEYQLYESDVDIVSITPEIETTGLANVNIQVSLKQNNTWSGYMNTLDAKGKKASAIKFRATYTVTTLDKTDSAKIKNVVCIYRNGNAYVSGTTAELMTITNNYENALSYARCHVVHDPLIDAKINAYVSFREKPKKREMLNIATGNNDRQLIQLEDKNINHNTLQVFYDKKPVYDFDYNTELSQLLITAAKDIAVTVNYEYGWEKEEWRQMQQSNTQKNINKGTYETDFIYELPSATDNKSISVIKLEMLRPEGHTQESLGKGTGKTQLYVLPHYAKKETILSNAQFSYDEESRIIKVIGAVNEDVTISYDWAAETQKIHGLVAAWNE